MAASSSISRSAFCNKKEFMEFCLETRPQTAVKIKLRALPLDARCENQDPKEYNVHK